MSEVDRLYVVFDADGKPYVKGLREIESQTKASGRTLESTFRTAGKAAGMAIAAVLVVGTAAIAGIGKASVKAAASFEYEMARVKAVANATGAEMAGMSKLALQLGKDTVFSAGEAAKGIYALATAGVSVADIMGGAAAAALDLAAAGELDVGRSAEIAAAAMNIFELKGKDVVAVADALAVGATKSAVEVSDMADAFNMSAAVAAQAGMSVQELTAAIALLGNAGIRGSDAGTSLKTMLMMLMAPTEQAADAMEQYGIEIYTASGEMKSLDESIAELDQSLAGLSQEEANHVKRVVAGQDAIRALNVLTKVGADNYRDMTDAVSRSGAAQDIAATKMDNLRGSYEQLKGSIETAFILMGTEGIPGLRSLVDSLTEETNRFLDAWERMTDSQAWKKGTYEIRFAMATDMAMEFLEDMAVKARNALTKVDWGTVANAVVGAIGRALSAAGPFVLEVAFDVVKDVATSPQTAKNMLKYGNLGSLVYQMARGARGPDSEYAYYQNVILGQGQERETSGLWRELTTFVGEYKAGLRELGEEEEAAWIRQQKLAHARREAKDITEDLARIKEELAAKMKQVAEITERLEGIYNTMIRPASIWEEADGSLSAYIESMDEALAAWGAFETNLEELAREFGPKYGAEVIMSAAELGPEFLAALMGADDATQAKVLEQLKASLGNNLDAQAAKIAELSEPVGTEAGETFARSWSGYLRRDTSMSKAARDAATIDLSAQGGAAASSWRSGFQASMGGGVSFDVYGNWIPESRAWGGPVASYDRGGLVGLPAPQKSTGRAVPIIAHEGEWVLTENQANFLRAGGVRGYADGGEVVGPSDESGPEVEESLGTLLSALDAWRGRLVQIEALMDVMGDTAGLVQQRVGALSGEYETYVELMREASTADEVMRYGQDAIDSLLDIYNTSERQLRQALDQATDALKDEQRAWEAAWDDRLEALHLAHEAERAALDDQARAVQSQYDAQLKAVDDQIEALRQAWSEEDRAAAAGDMERDLANLLSQGYYTEEDVRRIESLQAQVAAAKKQASREAEMQALESQRAAIEEKREQAAEELETKRAALEEQQRLQLEAMAREREEMRADSDSRLKMAEAAHAAELEALKAKYSGMIQTVVDQEKELLAETANYEAAGLALGEAFASGLLASIGSIQAAAQAMAQAASDYIELHSPAKKGPLARLDHWWDSFAETLVQPLEADLSGMVARLMADVQGVVSDGYFDASGLASMRSAQGGGPGQYTPGQNVFEPQLPYSGPEQEQLRYWKKLVSYDLDSTTGVGTWTWAVTYFDTGQTVYETETQQFIPSPQGGDYHQSYDQGGWLMPGTTIARNDTGVPELILPPSLLRGHGGDIQDVLRGQFPESVTHIHEVHISGDEANEAALPQLARLVSDEIKQQVEIVRYGGRR